MNKDELMLLLDRVKEKKEKQDMHTPYTERTGRLPDLEVEYIMQPSVELADIKPYQGMRCDFMYAENNLNDHAIYMIWPEILDAQGNVILDKTIELPQSGRAFMWAAYDEVRENVHQKRIKEGVCGYWMVGSKILAKVNVVKIIGLFTNQ